MTLKRIGILGGMGPEATVLLQQRLIKAVPALDDADHIPLLVDMNPAVPSRIAHLIEGMGIDPGPTLAQMARRLQDAGAQALAMPCNTAHHYADAITTKVRIPLLHMVDLAVEHAAARLPKGAGVGFLASPAVQQIGLFDRPLEDRGLKALWPNDAGAMLAAIRSIKTDGDTPASRATLAAASDELRSKGAQMQLIACSEFSIIADSAAPKADVVDTLDLLVRAIVEFARSGA